MKNPIFVAGSERCGTTILGKTLGLHPNILTFRHEPRLLCDPKGNIFDLLENISNESLREDMITHIKGPIYKRFNKRTNNNVGLYKNVEDKTYKEAIDNLVKKGLSNFDKSAIVREFIADIYSDALNLNQARRWCDDSPHTIFYMLQLIQVFPDMRFIHIIRNGLEVANSFLNQGWEKTPNSALKRWYNVVFIGRKLGKQLPKSNYLEVSFKSLSSEPEETLKKILDFIGEDWHEKLEKHIISEGRAVRFVSKLPLESEQLFYKLADDMIDEFGWSS